MIPRHDCAILTENLKGLDELDYAVYLIDERLSFSLDQMFPNGETKLICILPEGCDLAPGQFVQITGDGQFATITLHYTCDIADRTLFFTGRCNSNCVMCPYTTNWRKNAEDTALPELKRYMQLMNPFAPYLCVTGGEPTLLGTGFFTLLEYMRTNFRHTLVHVLTNGRAFCYGDFFEEYRLVRPPMTLLGIPLYASEAKLHDMMTGTSGSYDETLTGLNRLYRAGEKIELRIVVTALNLTDLSEIANLIIQRYPYIYMVSLMGLEMMGNAHLHKEQVWVPYDRVTPFLRAAVDSLVIHGIQTQIYNMPLCQVDHRHWPLCKKSISVEKVTYPTECSLCTTKNVCGGFFTANLHIPGIAVKPIGV